MKNTTAALALSVAVIFGWACNQNADIATYSSTKSVPMHVTGDMSEEEYKKFIQDAEKFLSDAHGKPMRIEDMRDIKPENN